MKSGKPILLISSLLLEGVIILMPFIGESQIRLPHLISNGMVLQRDVSVDIWGWANANEPIKITFADSVYHIKADDEGNWDLKLNCMPAGGPYQMTFEASNKITLNDIWLGDVWVCSGQSNMELPMRRVSWVYPNDVRNASKSNIRQFYVPRKYNFKYPEKDFEAGRWIKADSTSVLDFSAVGYFFAQEQYRQNHVAVGIINSSMGGSPIEAWLSAEALIQVPAAYNEMIKFRSDSLIIAINESDKKRSDTWYGELARTDSGHQQTNWSLENINTSDWKTFNIPDYWSQTLLKGINGAVWFRREVEIPELWAGKEAMIIIGRIVDADSVFVNGTFVGTTSYQYPPRRYTIPINVLKKGKNCIVIKVISNAGDAGFVPGKDYCLVYKKDTIDISGEWKYKIGAKAQPLSSQTFIRWKPGGLYNAMIAPLEKYRVAGFAWYQGEANTAKPTDYDFLLPMLINDWRTQWNNFTLPFIYVQLPNFMEVQKEPSESQWARLREAQLKSLSVNHTAMVVTIDAGEWNDIHPLKKKIVGQRMALALQSLKRNEKEPASAGPLMDTAIVDHNQIIISFKNIAKGLMIQGDQELKGFAIAGSDRNFVWAKAIINGNKIIISSPLVDDPVAVRYAWADNPEGANLYNADGFPASPFRTDDW